MGWGKPARLGVWGRSLGLSVSLGLDFPSWNVGKFSDRKPIGKGLKPGILIDKGPWAASAGIYP